MLHIVARSQETDTGARIIENTLSRTMLFAMASEYRAKMDKNEAILKMHISFDEEGKLGYQIN